MQTRNQIKAASVGEESLAVVGFPILICFYVGFGRRPNERELPQAAAAGGRKPLKEEPAMAQDGAALPQLCRVERVYYTTVTEGD